MTGDDGVARRAARSAARIGQRLPADPRQHPREIGVAGHRHPRLAPDEVEDPTRRPAAGTRQRRVRGPAPRAIRRPGRRRRPRRRRPRPARSTSSRLSTGSFGWVTTISGALVPAADRLDRVQPVLVDVDENVGRRQATQLVEVDVLGATDLRDAGDAWRRVDAKPGAGDEAPAQAEAEQQFGQARHQAGDPRRRPVEGIIRGRVRDRAVGRAAEWAGARVGDRANRWSIALEAHSRDQTRVSPGCPKTTPPRFPYAYFGAIHLYSLVSVWMQRLRLNGSRRVEAPDVAKKLKGALHGQQTLRRQPVVQHP